MGDIKEIVSFSRLKSCLIKRKTTSAYLSKDTGIPAARISSIITGRVFPKTDTIAKIACFLKMPVSEFVELKGIEPNEKQKKWFSEHEVKYNPAEDSEGNVSYAPLWELIDGFLEDVNEGKTDELKTANDIFDSIEPYRRVNECKGNGLTKEQFQDMIRKSVEVRYGKGYVAKRTNRKPYEAKGLTQETRTKLRNDRPLSMRTVYDICHKLGCSIDWVLSYK